MTVKRAPFDMMVDWSIRAERLCGKCMGVGRVWDKDLKDYTDEPCETCRGTGVESKRVKVGDIIREAVAHATQARR